MVLEVMAVLVEASENSEEEEEGSVMFKVLSDAKVPSMLNKVASSATGCCGDCERE